MLTVELHNVVVHGYHGVYEEERKSKQALEVNLDVSFDESGLAFERLGETIDYSRLFDIVKEKSMGPGMLLEKICVEIVQQVKLEYERILEIRISICKLNAPLTDFQGRAGVTLHRKFLG
jgi:dihydroneopterin aldolase